MATPFDAILDSSRALLEERVAEAVSAMLARAEASLNEIIDKTDSAEARGVLGAGRDAALRGREALEGEFGERFAKGFAKKVRKVKRGVSNRNNPGDQTGAFEIELELVGDDDLEETLSYNKLAARVRKHCDEGLGALDQRAAVMLGDGNLQSEDNPFGPKVVCDAFKNALREIETDAKVRAVFLLLFDEPMLDDLRSGYDDVNELLVENSILPKIRYTVVKKPHSARKAGADDVEDAEESAPAEPALPNDVFGALQKMLGGGAPAGGAPGSMGVGGVPMVQGAELMSSLSRLQVGNLEGVTGVDLAALNAAAGSLTNVLAQLKESSVGQSMGQVDAMTLNVVSLLFDKLFDDAKVPAGIKALAARLQIPMLKVAIADKALFSENAHPARVHLDLLGELGARLSSDFDDKHEMYPKLEPVEREIVDKFEDNVEVFDAANEKLKAFIAEEDQRVAQATQVESKRLEQLENLSAGRTAAQEEIRTRLREHHPGKAVRDFLAQQWIKVLLVVHAQSGRDSEPWKAALATMDQLLWSVEPKPKQEEQRKLASQVPALLRSLTTALNGVGVEDSVRQAFYSELMKLHTAVMALDSKPRGGGDTHAAKPAAPKPPAPGTAAAIAAQLAPPPKAEDETLDFTAEITVKNPFGGGEVQVDELDFTEAQPALEAAPKAEAKPDAKGAKAAPEKEKKPAKDLALPSKLKEGVWVGIRDAGKDSDEPRLPAKLLYMSPLKSRFLFCDRGGRKVLECNRAELAKRFKLREVVIIKGDPDASLFERILRGVMSSLGAEAA
ncbi:MAG TPA: DUF1631 family protein [Usitatibacter sp.]|nr:DUF1631 family protein [Usitatibacter sp.]